MVQKRMRSTEELAQISGVGESKIEAHGARFLERLKELQAGAPGKGGRDEAHCDPPR